MISIDNAGLFKRLPHVHAQTHAKRLDKLLGYRIPKIEVKLLQKYRAYYKDSDETNRKTHFHGTQTWIGLHPQVLQTPYNDIYEALSELKDQEVFRIVDVGSAYGRVGLISSNIFPNARFIGYEIVKKRADEANRIYAVNNLINCEVINTNVLTDEFIFPEAEIYFIYDFSEADHIRKALIKICKKMKFKKTFLVVRGERVEAVLKKQFNFIFTKARPLPHSLLSIYESKENLKNCSSL